MEYKDDEFQSLRLKVDKISSELEKQHAIRAVNTKWMVIVGSIVVATFGFTSLVQVPREAAKAAKEQITPEIVAEAKRIVSSLQKKEGTADKYLEILNNKATNTIGGTGTLAFFDKSNCPEGWEELKKGAGRFLIASGSVYPFGTDGGKEKVSLTVNEMPRHEHRNPVYRHGGMTKSLMTLWALQAGEKKGNYKQNPRPTQISGGGKPHENMPPFLAYTLCRKQ